MTKFRIILPTIGRASLPGAIESVLAQTYRDFQLIISYDRHDVFESVAHQYGDPKILHISRGNLSQSNDSGASARNYAINTYLATDDNIKYDDWITYIDDDDVWHSDRLWRFNIFIENHRHDPAFSMFYSYGDLWKFKHRSPRSSRKEPRRIGLVDNITCGGICHTLEVFQATKGWNPNNLEDHDKELFHEMRNYGSYDILEESTFDFYWR